MRLGEINLDLKPLQPTFSLCKPDKTIIAPLKDIYNVELSVKLGKVNELNFTIPSQIERNHNLIENPLIDKIKHRFLVKMVYNYQTEYFVFLDQNKQYDEGTENLSYKLFGLGYLLADKQIRSFKAEAQSLLQIASSILEHTSWKVTHVDAAFNVGTAGTRNHEIDSQTILQAIYELADKFNAVLVWDTVNLSIEFYQPVNIGTNKGLKFKEGKYLESFNINSNSEETVTRLYVYGQDGLTFRSLTPTGSHFIQDFGWYMYPFERDVNGNIISSSDYMSDDLCIALENYGLTLDAVGGQFGALANALKLKQDEIQQEEQILSLLTGELSQILDELDVSNAAGDGHTESHDLIIQSRVNKETEIAASNARIENFKTQKTTIENEIQDLSDTVKMENHLSAANLIELDSYIIEKDYTNNTIIEEDDLLIDGLKAFNEFREPKVNMTLDLVNFLSSLEAQNNWKKLSLGDIVKLESHRLRIGIEAKIIEINYNFESDAISLTIANEKELKDDYRKLLDLIYTANATSTSVNLNKFKWDMIEEANNLVSQLYFGAIDTIKNNITAGYLQSIEITERGIIVRSPSDPMRMLVIQNGLLALSNDGGNRWANAITAQGIIGETIIGRLIMGSRLLIEDENGIIRFSGSLQEVFDNYGNVRIAIGEYAQGKYGMRIDSGSIEIIGDSNNNLIDEWNSAEQNAKEYADGLLNGIQEEFQDVSEALANLDDFIYGAFSDNVIDLAEKEALKVHIEQINIQKSELDARYTEIYTNSFLTGTPKSNLATAKSFSGTGGGYDQAHVNLLTAITVAIQLGTVSPADKIAALNAITAAFTDYRAKLANLSKRIEEALKAIEIAILAQAGGDARAYADSIKASLDATIGTLSNTVADLSSIIDGAFEDNVIDIAEKHALAAHIEQLNNEKANFDTQYTMIYANPNLASTAKTNLLAAKTNGTTGYDIAHTNLISAINVAIADNLITDAEKTSVSNAFSTYRTRLSTLVTRLREAIEYIEVIMAAKTLQDAKNHTDEKDTSIRSDLRLTSPLPTSITLNSNGITAFNTSDTSKLARMDHRGLYVQNGAIDLRTGAASNRGVIFDGTGLRGYNTSGTRTFEIDSFGNAYFSGQLSGATGSFSGSLSAATGTFSGSLSAAGGSFNGDISGATGTFSGNLNAAGGTFRGQLSSATGTFSGSLSAATGSFSGSLSAATGTFSGTLSGNSIIGAVITGGSISSNTSINITTDINVGNNIYLGDQTFSSAKSIVFSNAARIVGTWSTLKFSASHLDFSDVSTISWGTIAPVARFG
ncbi:phage tail protein [Solibacillus sp. FSL H8-0523]|uniref:phage tail protein n=1 Tax=Solibacillus sp. FSL H8-0523 TaxID=2954511 RepID=UPI0031012F35